MKSVEGLLLWELMLSPSTLKLVVHGRVKQRFDSKSSIQNRLNGDGSVETIASEPTRVGTERRPSLST